MASSWQVPLPHPPPAAGSSSSRKTRCLVADQPSLCTLHFTWSRLLARFAVLIEPQFPNALDTSHAGFFSALSLSSSTLLGPPPEDPASPSNSSFLNWLQGILLAGFRRPSCRPGRQRLLCFPLNAPGDSPGIFPNFIIRMQRYCIRIVACPYGERV